MSLTQTTSPEIVDIQLAQGSRLLFKPMPGAPRLALNIYAYGGNRVEEAPGLADMVDDLLMEGTQKRTLEQIAVDLDSLSLDVDMDTRRDYSVMSSTFLEEDLEASIEFMADMLFHSTLTDVEKEKVRLHGELMMDMDSPRNRAHDLLMTRIFEGSPYRASNSNILKTIPTITSAEPLHQHYQRVYQPQNLLISVVGDTDIQTLQTLLAQYLQRATGDNLANAQPAKAIAIAQDEYRTSAKDDSAQLHIYKGWLAPHNTHPDYAAMVVLNCILGGAGLTSRLFLELRDKQGLAYTVRSQYEASQYIGLFNLYIGTDPSNRQKALDGFKVECQKLVDTAVSAQELAEAKENVLGRRVVFLETAAQQCAYLGANACLGLSLHDIAALDARILSVTSQDIQRVAYDVFGQGAITTAVGPSSAL